MVLIPVDRKDDAYRCHRLLRQMLRAELRRREPAREALLHARAAEWFEAAGEPDRALHHAAEAGDAPRAARLVRAVAPGHVTPLRDRTLRRRLACFDDGQAAVHPGLALAAANSDFLRGDLDGVHRWASAVAGTLVGVSPSAWPAEHEAAAALLRAAVAQDGLVAMRDDAARAYALEPPDSPWRAPCCLLEGVALHLTGDREAAERRLEEGVRRAAVAAPNVQTLCLAQLALLAAEREDWEAGAGYVARAVAQVGHYGLEAHPTTALVFAAQAVVDARRGRIAEARDALTTGRRLLESLVDFAPWYEVEARIALARAALRLSDVAAARALRVAAARHARRIPETAVLDEWMSEVSALGDAAATSAAGGPAALTTAELRILTFLPTHLSFREIAERLYVSANTVKTQAHAIYRKLDAVSRSEAVSRAAELGLLDNAVL